MIREDVPTINKILKILLPTIFPIAISAFFFIDADTEVNNSGKEVPKATIVNPIKRSLTPSSLAILVAASTDIFDPRIIAPKPIKAKIIALITLILFST